MVCWGKKIAKRNFLATVSIQTFITLILTCTRFNLSIFIKMTHWSKIQNSKKHLLDLTSPSSSKWPAGVKLGSLDSGWLTALRAVMVMVICRGWRCSRLVLYRTLPRSSGKKGAKPVSLNFVPQIFDVTSTSLLL